MDSFERQDADNLLDGCPHDIFYFSPMPINLDGPFVQINRAGYAGKTPSDFCIQRGADYRYNLIHCITRGRGSIQVKDECYEVKRGQLFLLPAQEPHIYRSDPSDPLGLMWVEFGGGGSTAIVRFIYEQNGPVYEGTAFNSVLSRCTSVLYESNQKISKLSAIVYNALMDLCEDISNSDITIPKNQEILRFIDSNLGAPVTLKMTADHFGYNPSYFSHRFSQTVGMRFSEYVLYRRISSACYLLLNTDRSIERIARELGFYDTSHFTQRFKASEGMTPANYRRQGLRGGAEVPEQLRGVHALTNLPND